MKELLNKNTSANASISIDDLNKILQNIYALIHLVESKNLNINNIENDALLYAIEDLILNFKNILNI